MPGKTAGVKALVEEVLQTFATPYSEDVTEEVFVAIESNRRWQTLYNELFADLGRDVLNQWIGRYTKIATGRHKAMQVEAKRTSLTTSYSKLNP